MDSKFPFGTVWENQIALGSHIGYYWLQSTRARCTHTKTHLMAAAFAVINYELLQLLSINSRKWATAFPFSRLLFVNWLFSPTWFPMSNDSSVCFIESHQAVDVDNRIAKSLTKNKSKKGTSRWKVTVNSESRQSFADSLNEWIFAEAERAIFAFLSSNRGN